MLWTYQEGEAADCNAGWGVGDMGSWEAPVPSQYKMLKMWSVPCETLSLWRIQTLSLSTVFIDYS